MTSPRRFALPLALVILLPFAAAHAQRPSVSTVNITPEEGRVRVAGTGGVFDLKIEVLNEAGETVFEAAQVSDQRLDWNMTDSAGRRVAPGTYTVTVSYSTPSGKPRKRVEQVVVTEEVKGGEKKATAAAPNPQPLVDGGGTANKIPKFTDTDTLTSSVIMDVSGRVGIGTAAAPATGLRLEVNGITKLTPGGSGGYMQLGTPNTETGLTWSKPATSTTTASRADIRFNGSRLLLAAGSGAGVPTNTGVIINTSGYVGIGTTDPLAKLHVIGGYRGIWVSNTAPVNSGYGSSAIYASSPNIAVAGISPDNGVGIFGRSDGGIGVWGITTNGFAGYFDGRVQVNGPLTATGNVCAANIPCPSDARLKQNVTNLKYGLDQLLRLRPVSWHWKSEPGGSPQMGLVAQEVETVIPELVLKDADQTKPLALNYMALLPVAVKAIQEQQALIQEQQKQLAQLQARVAQLEQSAKRRQQARARR